MEQLKKWASRYVWGILTLLSQVFGWLSQITWSTALTTSTAIWFRGDDVAVLGALRWFVNLIGKLFGQDDHCALSVLNDIQHCRDFLQHEKVGHMVLNQDQAKDYLEYLERKDALHVPDPVSDLPDADPVAEPVQSPDPRSERAAEPATPDPVDQPGLVHVGRLIPGSSNFDAEAWFFAHNEEERARIVYGGVMVKMPVEQRREVARIAQRWWNSDAKPASGHGMDDSGDQQ